MSAIVILGTGGHARVLAEALRATGKNATLSPPDADAALLAHGPQDVLLVNGLGSVGDASVRRGLFERFHHAGFQFLGVIHPAATIATDVAIETGAQVMAAAVLQTGVTIGANAIVNSGAIVDHDSRIGAHAHVATGARLAGNITVGAGAHIGAGATIIQGIIIGERAIVAAGAVVVNDVPPDVTVMGVPAKQKI